MWNENRGRWARRCTPATFSITQRVRWFEVSVAQLTSGANRPAMRPLRSVSVSWRSMKLISPFFASTARARSIRCGKSSANGMRRHIGALGHEAHVAQRAGFDDRLESFALHRVEFAGRRIVDQVEQARERVAQIEAAAAAVADVEDAAQFGVELGFVVEIGIVPRQRMARAACRDRLHALAMDVPLSRTVIRPPQPRPSPSMGEGRTK